jgi:hypothetical protein
LQKGSSLSLNVVSSVSDGVENVELFAQDGKVAMAENGSTVVFNVMYAPLSAAQSQVLGKQHGHTITAPAR